ncbi:hypothetical protein [Muribaculum sp.]|uniref:hypothetical protein n=1 Tax=Muribaculum sp. TaxID=1918611 RepID=UPI0023CD010D|nr:hypothetical protein [Muribaculum sp.]MDE5704706.1 hypothetical protein [Muribaculum sp.]
MGASLWIAWALIGIIGGFMVGKLIPRIRNLTLALCVSICGAMLGGYLFLVFLGNGSTNTEVLSLVSSAVVCALFLWALTIASPRRNDDESPDE